MNEQIIAALKIKLDSLSAYGTVDAETKRNALKEELQFYVLNFIYHDPEYGKWIMYGGSALRICHGLDRMSVDLDFEIDRAIDEKFLEELKTKIEKHFAGVYGVDPEFLKVKITTGRGLLLKFQVGDELSIGQPSKQVHAKIDLNHFVAPKTVIERIPINRGQFSFVILTYNMSALMASKIAAIFSRGTRGVGAAVYEEKGRDIYDLLWYMSQKAAPDFDYLIAKGIDVNHPRALFDKLTLKMNKVSDANLKQDLTPLFLNRNYIENWLQNWRESYLRLLDEYKIHTVATLRKIITNEDPGTDNFSFTYLYETAEGVTVRVIYIVSYEWIKNEKVLGIAVNEDAVKLVAFESGEKLSDQIKQFITLFYEKTEAYFKKTNRIMLGGEITTKAIRTSADNLNQREQIVLNKSTLLSCELEDLLK